MSDRDLRLQRLKTKKTRAFRKKVAGLGIVVLLVVVLVAVYSFSGGGGPAANSRVLLVTSMGNITIELYEDMPITTGNFKNLVSQGLYDGTAFHRVAHSFVIQGGELPNKHQNVMWSVAMAKTSQPNSATSQFFINLKDNSAALDSNYSVFGMVVNGTDVVAAIGNAKTEPADDGTPLTTISITSVRLIS
jgi:peptidylprolyl isomerase